MWKMSKNEPAEAAIPVVLEEMDFLVDAMAAQSSSIFGTLHMNESGKAKLPSR